MRKLFNARGISAALAFASAIGLVGCGADVGQEGAAGEGEIGSSEQAIAIGSLTAANTAARVYPSWFKVNATTALVFGGYSAAGVAQGSTEQLVFSGGVAAWTNKTAIPTPRAEAQIAEFPGTDVIAIIGGIDANGLRSNQIDLYDISANTMTTVTATLPTGLVQHAVVPCGTGAKLLVIAGEDDVGPTPVSTLSVITLNAGTPASSTVDPLKDVSNNVITLNTARMFHSADSIDANNTKLLAVAGEDTLGNVLGTSELIEVSTACVAQNVSSNKPSLTASLPSSAVRTRGTLKKSTTTFTPSGGVSTAFEAYFFGGFEANALPVTTFAYDLNTNVWKLSPASLPATYGGMRFPATVDGTLIKIAGADIGSLVAPTSTKHTAVYDPASGGSWSAGTDMTKARFGNVTEVLSSTQLAVFGQNTTAVAPATQFTDLNKPE